MAVLAPEFQKRGVKMIALSCDDVESHNEWIKDIKAYTKTTEFPYSIIADPSRELAVQFGMVDPDEKDKKGLPLTCRAVRATSTIVLSINSTSWEKKCIEKKDLVHIIC